MLSKLLPKKIKDSDVKLSMDNEQVPNKQIADVLNKAFNEVGFLRLQTPSCNISQDSLNSLQTLSVCECEFKLSDIKKDYVLQQLQNIDCKKAVGVDGIHPRFLKLAAIHIVDPMIYYLFNMSIKTCIIPKDFKTARISPIHKGGSHDIDNFRPISILPSLSY